MSMSTIPLHYRSYTYLKDNKQSEFELLTLTLARYTQK